RSERRTILIRARWLARRGPPRHEPGSIEPGALRVGAEVELEHARGVGGEVVHPHPLVRLDHDLEAFLELRRAGEMLDRVFRASSGRDVRAAPKVITRDVILVLGEAVP